MQRNTSLWIYFVSLLLAAGMTFALLPACGGGGGNSCNTEATAEEQDNTNCELEEVDEEELDGEQELLDETREETGNPSPEDFAEHDAEDIREAALP